MLKFHLDWQLLIFPLLLSLLGLLILRSVAPGLLANQFLFFVIAAAAFVVFSLIDYQILFSLPIPIYLISVTFLVTPFIFGAVTRGATRWLQFGQFTLQPSEMIKPFLIMVFSVVASAPPSGKNAAGLVLGLMLPFILIFKQPDLGSALVLLAGWLVIFLYRFPLRWFLPLVFTFLLLIFPVYKYVLHDYQQERIQTFINPYVDPLGQGYHVIQSIIAVGSGEIAGRGLGQGSQSQLRFLPERHTDFIFASMAEELGFVGSLLVLILYLSLLYRIYRISQTVSDPMAALFCLSITSLLAFQIVVNIGMNLGLAPVTGITLPFISYGGSSLVSLGITLGILNSISGRSYRGFTLRIR